GNHFALMETMTTRDYLDFRDKLSPASGFQSAQLREMEILMGLLDEDRIPFGHEKSYREALKNPDGSPSFASEKVRARLEDRPSLREAIHHWLLRTPIQGSFHQDPGDDETLQGFIDAYLASHAEELDRARRSAIEHALSEQDRTRLDEKFETEKAGARNFLYAEDVPEAQRKDRRRLRASMVFIESYRELPLLAWPREILEGLVHFEQSFLIFRQRHARMVERMIGRRVGTGGSAGVDYLDRTALKYRVFHDLWAARTVLLREAALPPIQNAEVYGFAVE
ncbi:MAG: tryptophan 2,3-dioxygenase family protein, partial [Myxococcota bacterium]